MIGEATAVSALGVTVGLVLWRPRVGKIIIGPAIAAAAGITLMAAVGHLEFKNIADAAGILWKPIIAVGSIMLIASAAEHLGVINRLATTVAELGRGSVSRLYLLVFCLGAFVATALNNDSAILVLTPLVIVMVRRLFPQNPALIVPFAFAVFMAAGVAPLITSNPINLIVAKYVGLNFNSYAVRMFPVALVSMIVSFLVLRWYFSPELGKSAQANAAVPTPKKAGSAMWSKSERSGLILVLGTLATYPVVAYFGGEVWNIALLGAMVACLICRWFGVIEPTALVYRGVAWQILVFLFGMYTLAIGLRNAGAVDWLIALYTPADTAVIGVVSAVGSALINNHSMALTNIVAIDALALQDNTREMLAALIGGDLGPRLLPIGSLAGLLWYAALDRLDVKVPILLFVKLGFIVTVPSLTAALFMLTLTQP